MSGYGDVVRETAAEAHERKVQAIEAVLWGHVTSLGDDMRTIAEECLAAAEAGF